MPVRVLMFGWELPPFNSGGLGVACQGLTQALAKEGVEITFVLPQRQNIKVSHMRLVFADIEFPWPNYSVYQTGLPGSDSPLPKNLLDAVNLYARRAHEISKAYSHDLVHAHDWLCFGAGVVASQTGEKPLVTHVHATEFDRSGGNGINPVVFNLEKLGLTRSKSVIAVSRFTANLLEKHYSTAPQKINVIHNGIDPDEFTSPSTTNPFRALKEAGYKIVIFVGRLTLQKGPDYFIKCARKVLDLRPQTVFVFVGSGDMENQLIEQATSLGISDKVLFAGFVRGNMHKEIFKSADLFVMPSVSEPFGITALEAIAAGTPAIISKESGVAEAVSHVLKADFWDVDEMTNQVLAVLDYPSLKKVLGENGKKESQSKSWSAAAAKTIKVYKKVINK